MFFESNIQSVVMNDCYYNETCYFEMNAMNASVLNESSFINILVDSNGFLKEKITFLPLNLIIKLVNNDSQDEGANNTRYFKSLQLHDKLILNPREHEALSALEKGVEYRLSSVIVRYSPFLSQCLTKYEGRWFQCNGLNINAYDKDVLTDLEGKYYMLLYTMKRYI